MLIKKGVARTLANVLSGIKLNKLTDKSVKLALIKDHLAFRKIAKELDEDQDEIVSKFRQDWGDELYDVQKLRNDEKIVTGHDEFLAAEKDANIALSELFNTEVEVDIQAVSMDRFVSSFTEDDITLEYIAFLADNGVVE